MPQNIPSIKPVVPASTTAGSEAGSGRDHVLGINALLALKKQQPALVTGPRVHNAEKKDRDNELSPSTTSDSQFSYAFSSTDDGKNKRKRRMLTAEEKQFVCPHDHCSKAYGSAGSLKQHLKAKHAFKANESSTSTKPCTSKSTPSSDSVVEETSDWQTISDVELLRREISRLQRALQDAKATGERYRTRFESHVSVERIRGSVRAKLNEQICYSSELHDEAKEVAVHLPDVTQQDLLSLLGRDLALTGRRSHNSYYLNLGRGDIFNVFHTHFSKVITLPSGVATVVELQEPLTVDYKGSLQTLRLKGKYGLRQ